MILASGWRFGALAEKLTFFATEKCGKRSETREHFGLGRGNHADPFSWSAQIGPPLVRVRHERSFLRQIV
jgi:hypothetical protein